MKRTKDELLLDCIEQFKHMQDVYDFNQLTTTKSLIKEIEEAINYTSCCELLKGKKEMTFYEYLISKGYKLSDKHVWQIDNRDLSNIDLIKQRKEYEYSL